MRFLLVSIGWASLPILTGCGDKSSALPYSGTWRVVNYWAIWCAPCREEIPELNALHQDSPLTVLAVNYDGQQGETLTRQAAELGIRFELLEQDPGPELGIERPRVLPTTLLIDPEGVVTDILVGPQTQENLATLWELRRS